MRTGPQVQRALEEVSTLYRAKYTELNKQQSIEMKRIQDTCPHDIMGQIGTRVYCHWCSKDIGMATERRSDPVISQFVDFWSEGTDEITKEW